MRSTRNRSRRLSTALLPLLLFACDEPTGVPDRGEPPSFLLVTLDTTRADRIGAYGYDAAETPALDALADRGVLFERAYTPAPITLPSHASMLTGLYPRTHGVRDNGRFVLAPETVLVSEVLREAGWRTAAFVGSFVLDARFGLDQGFETYAGPAIHVSRPTLSERPGNEVADDAIAWLTSLAPGERFFLWAHFFDPHAPYAPPAPWSERHGDPYDAEIAFADAQLRRVVEAAQVRTAAADLVIAVAADHGESLGEHDEPTHGFLLYQATMRVPLILSGGRLGRLAGTRVTHPVSTADLAVTFLALAGIDPGALPDARVPPLLSGSAALSPGDPKRLVLLETLFPYHMMGWRGLIGLVHGDDKFILGREPELYALDDDPGELRNLASTRRGVTTDYGRQVRTAFADPGPPGRALARNPDSEERALLASLGYLAGDASGDPFARDLPDPRDRAAGVGRGNRARELFHRWVARKAEPRAATAFENARRESEGRAWLEEARALFVEVIAESPGAAAARIDLASVELELGNAEAAVEILEDFTDSRWESSEIHFNLALAYEHLGRSDDALRAARGAIDLASPVAPQYYQWLAMHHAGAGQFGRAVWWLDELLAILPPSPARTETGRHRAEFAVAMRERGQTPAPPPDLESSGGPG